MVGVMMGAGPLTPPSSFLARSGHHMENLVIHDMGIHHSAF